MLENAHLGSNILSAIELWLNPKQRDFEQDEKDNVVKVEQAILFNERNYLIGDLSMAQKLDILTSVVGPTNPLITGDAPSWIWEQLENPVFLFLLDSVPYGAITKCAQELGFPLKLLISSQNIVTTKFAEYCSTKSIRPKSVAYATSINNTQVQYRTSNGAMNGRKDHRLLIGTKEWFKDVVKRRKKPENPMVDPEQYRIEAKRILGIAEQDNRRIEKEINTFKTNVLERVRNHLRAQDMNYLYTQSWLANDFLKRIQKISPPLDIPFYELEDIQTRAKQIREAYDRRITKAKFWEQRADALEPETLEKLNY